MDISQLEQEFWGIYETIPEEIRSIQGINELSPFQIARSYFKESVVADSSIDPNANVSGKSPVNFQSEIFKPQLKIRGYYEIWERLYSKYGKDEAYQILYSMLDGTLYFHDITKIDVPYCFAFDTSLVAMEGRPYGWLPGSPPKRSSSFIGQVVETTMDFSQQLAGAVGVPNILVNLAYYTRKEREELHRLVGKISNEPDAILAIALFMSGLGYSGSQFSIEAQEVGDLEWKIQSYMMEKGITLIQAVDMAYNKYVEDLIQHFVHVMHNTFRIGGDSPFTNISIFDRHFIETFLKDAMYPDFSSPSDNADEIIRVQKLFVNFFIEGSPVTNKKYRFPVATVNLKKWEVKDLEEGLCKAEDVGKIADNSFFSWIVKKNLARGTFNLHIGAKVATCCRLTSDLSELMNQIRSDTFGNGGMSIGSHRVVLVNLHRVALLYRMDSVTVDMQEFLRQLGYYMEQAKKVLLVHKELLEERVNSKFLQFFNINWCDLKQFFSTFGYTGLFDAYSVLYPNIEPREYPQFYAQCCAGILDFMDDYSRISGKQHEGYAFNLEEVPGENACPKLASMDNFYFSSFDWYEPKALLSNQMVPLYYDMDLFDRLSICGELMNKVSGGSIFHVNITEGMTEATNEELHRMIIEDYNIPHYAINVGSTTCKQGHTSIGIHWKCPVEGCNAEIDTHTIRIIGYESDTKDWVKARREVEWKEFRRQFYVAQDILCKQ